MRKDTLWRALGVILGLTPAIYWIIILIINL